MRGEYIEQSKRTAKRWGSPPHARGIHILRSRNDCKCGITPACAGNTIRVVELIRHAWDHPRMRGEYREYFIGMKQARGSPPHARGILFDDLCRAGNIGITPACAGNTSTMTGWANVTRDHPRMRGEYTELLRYITGVAGSPPHARGILPVWN